MNSGIAGIFTDEHKVVEAARTVRQTFNSVEAISPYPLHGMEDALQIPRSCIPYVTFVGGLVGMFTGLFITIWTSAYDWPINVGGKPYVSLPAFIPIVFELTILFGALSSVVALAWFCRIPKLNPPIIDPDLSSHKFALFIPTSDKSFNAEQAENLLRQVGALEVKKVSEY